MIEDWRELDWTKWRPFTRGNAVIFTPDGPGLYLLRHVGIDMPLLYVGQSGSLRRRLRGLSLPDVWLSVFKQPAIKLREVMFSCLEVERKQDRLALELKVIEWHLGEFGTGPMLNLARSDLGSLHTNRIELVDPDGQPLSSERKLLVGRDVRFVERQLMQWLAEKPERLHQLEPRVFEEVVAEIFHKKGYEVTLTPQTRDGGKDIYAIKNDSLARFLCIIECKRYAPDHPVDIGILRSLYGVQQAERVPVSVVATTSRFTSDAEQFHRNFQQQMMLKEFRDISLWIDEYLRGPKGSNGLN